MIEKYVLLALFSLCCYIFLFLFFLFSLSLLLLLLWCDILCHVDCPLHSPRCSISRSCADNRAHKVCIHGMPVLGVLSRNAEDTMRSFHPGCCSRGRGVKDRVNRDIMLHGTLDFSLGECYVVVGSRGEPVAVL